MLFAITRCDDDLVEHKLCQIMIPIGSIQCVCSSSVLTSDLENTPVLCIMMSSGCIRNRDINGYIVDVWYKTENNSSLCWRRGTGPVDPWLADPPGFLCCDFKPSGVPSSGYQASSFLHFTMTWGSRLCVGVVLREARLTSQHHDLSPCLANKGDHQSGIASPPLQLQATSL